MTRLLAFTLFVFLAVVSKGHASSPEQLAARQWLDTHLTKCELTAPSSIPVPVLPKSPEPGLDVYANNDPVILRSRGNSPLKIGERTFSRGLYCHAVSKVVVHLPGSGKRFSALAGLDHNEDTARGRGSVVFSVTVGDKTVFQSEVMRFGTPGREVDVLGPGSTHGAGRALAGADRSRAKHRRDRPVRRRPTHADRSSRWRLGCKEVRRSQLPGSLARRDR